VEPRTTFTLLPLMHWISVLILAGSGALALAGFMHLAVAVASAAVLTYLLKAAVQRAAQAFMVRKLMLGLLCCAGGALVASVTVGLNAATLYASVFAKPSAIAEWTARREPHERELQRVLALAGTAQTALTVWAQDARAKAAREGAENGGGSCPNLADTGGSRGPVAKWREDDSTIAQSLATELESLSDGARRSTALLLGLPKPTDFAAVKAGYEAANRASDDITRLTSDGSYAAATVGELERRRTSTIERSGQAAVTCGDSARLAFIDRATVALSALSALKPMPRMEPGMDLSDPHDVLSRSLLRSFNGVAAMATLGFAGSFNGDRLMQEALKTNGLINSQTLAFGLSFLAELAVIGTALLMVRQGQAPFVDNAVSWIRAEEQAHADASRVRRLVRGAAKRLVNAFYVVETDPAPADAAAAVRPGQPEHLDVPGLPAESSVIQLPDDPRLSREREAEWTGLLLAHHVPWGDIDLVMIPVTPEHAPVAQMARALFYQGQATLLASAAPARLLNEPEVATHLAHANGPDWQQHLYQVFMLAPGYAQVMRLRAIRGQAGALPTVQVSSPSSGRHAAHQPLSHRLARRPARRRTVGR
jgi:hypothetical protein